MLTGRKAPGRGERLTALQEGIDGPGRQSHSCRRVSFSNLPPSPKSSSLRGTKPRRLPYGGGDGAEEEDGPAEAPASRLVGAAAAAAVTALLLPPPAPSPAARLGAGRLERSMDLLCARMRERKSLGARSSFPCRARRLEKKEVKKNYVQLPSLSPPKKKNDANAEASLPNRFLG